MVPLLLSLLCIAFVPSMSMRLRMSMLLDRPKIVVFGASGYIGKFVVKESVARGYETTAVVRPGRSKGSGSFSGASTVYSDLDIVGDIKSNVFDTPADVVISCLASRSGVKDDSMRVDYQATLNALNAAIDSSPQKRLKHFILLSAFCVGKPLLQFQHAKLKFEAALQSAQKEGRLERYSIVRPTAYFKSVSGQFELVQQGWPFVMFGKGDICSCNPIAETDLASYMLNCITEEDKWNKILNIGGPDEGYTMRQQGELLFEVLGKEPNFVSAPIGVFDAIIGGLDFAGRFSKKAEDAAELARIGKYYAVEDMLTQLPAEKYGAVTLRQHYERILREGQEYDPYTTMLAPKPKKASA